ncbi:hypothetical protein HDU80_010977 [Chytriomyces hyalinus]|nr:hypothetical protein HDU80_010977 [Chytriomyces hyalinus]
MLWDALKFGYESISWIRNNFLTFLIMAVIGISLWWKMLISQQADGIQKSLPVEPDVEVDGEKKDAKKKAPEPVPAPAQEVTFAALTRKALTSPAALLKEAAQLGVYHVKWIMAAPLVVAASPNIATVVLSEKFNCNRHAYNTDPKGTLSQQGDEHAKSHALLVKIFADSTLTDSLIAQLQSRLASETLPELTEAASSKENLDLLPVFEELWVDVVALWILGVPTPAELSGTTSDVQLQQTKRRERLVEARRCLANLTFVLPTGYAWYFDRLRENVPFTEYFPLPGFREYLARRNGKTKARKIVFEEYKAMATEYNEHGTIRGGLAGALLKETIAALPEGKVLDDAAWQKIYVELEGIQTTAQMPLFSIVPHLLFLLAHSPTNQKLVMAEISKVNAKTSLTVKHVSAMTNLNACLLEALRLCPPQAVSYNRTSSQNAYRLPGQWSFPKNAHIAIDLLSTMRDQEAFGKDSNSFSPSRFSSFQYTPTDQISKVDAIKSLKSAIENQPPTQQSAFIPFGSGTYACPAQRLALDVCKIAVAEVLRKFELVAVKGRESVDATEIVEDMDEFVYQQSGVLRHADGAPVAVKKRK